MFAGYCPPNCHQHLRLALISVSDCQPIQYYVSLQIPHKAAHLTFTATGRNTRLETDIVHFLPGSCIEFLAQELAYDSFIEAIVPISYKTRSIDSEQKSNI
jgi:hypothetical protein